jgi:hypothetical protein
MCLRSAVPAKVTRLLGAAPTPDVLFNFIDLLTQGASAGSLLTAPLILEHDGRGSPLPSSSSLNSYTLQFYVALDALLDKVEVGASVPLFNGSPLLSL